MALDWNERFDGVSQTVHGVLTALAPDEVDALHAQTRDRFLALADEIPYADRPEHIMFPPAFSVFVYLALYQVLRARDLDVHAIGRAMLEAPQIDIGPTEEGVATVGAAAEESMRGAPPEEFTFELVAGDGEIDFGMNVHSCGVCHAYAKHDAMELIPYICAMDDVASDATGRGLRRTGTIGLGASHCDFRYKIGGEPLRLADQYPDRIRTSEPSPD